MDLAELQRRVDPHTKVNLGPLYEAYRARGGGEDVEGFLSYLGETGAIDPSILRELYGTGGVEVAMAGDAVFAGTRLAAWTSAASSGAAPARTAAGATANTGSATAGAGTLGSAGASVGATVADGATAQAAAAHAAPAHEIHFYPVAKLGQGAMGAVHIAQDVYLRRKVALKSVLPQMAGHPQLFGRFLAEMQITAQLEHPNIVPIYAIEVGADGSLGYAMKLVQGRDLEKLLAEARALVEQKKPLEGDHRLETRLEYFLKLCDAVAFAHDKGVIHRDLKPANVMIGSHHEVYLMDWGIARLIGAGGQATDAGIELFEADGKQTTDLGRTRVGSAVGSPLYMSPEQAEGRNAELDGRSDLYTLGLILQECVTLRRAIDGTTLEEVLTKVKAARRDFVPVGQAPGELPRELEAVVRRATQRQPKDRYPSVRVFADDVRRYLRGEAVEALPEGALRRAGRWLSRHRMATLTLILGLGMVGTLGTLGAVVVGQARIEAEHARELRVSQMATESAIQAQLVDRQLTRYESALTELAGAAEALITRDAGGDEPPLFADQLTAPGTAPPDFAPAARYGRPVSVLAPVVTTAPGADRAPLDKLLRSLRIGPAFRAAMIGASGGDWHTMSVAQQRALIADTGVPVYRLSIDLREGATVSFPAMAGGDPSPGKPVASKPGVEWGAVRTVDKETVLPGRAALYDHHGAFRGDARIEVSLSRLLQQKDRADLDYVQSRILVGRDGKVVAEDNEAEGRAPLAPEVSAAMAQGRSGTMVATVDGRSWQYAYYPLSTLDWYYVAAGEARRLITSTKKVVTSDPRKVLAAAAPAAPPPPPAAAPPPAPVDAGAEDAGDASDAGDAGDDAGNAGAEPAVNAGDAGASALDARFPGRLPGPMPKTKPTGAPAAAPPAATSNPFDNWNIYKKKGEK